MTTYEFSAPFGIWDLLLFRALRLWPDNERSQINFLRHAYRVQESAIETTFPDSIEMPDVIEHLKGIRSSLGGREMLNMLDSAEAIERDILQITKEGQLAGLILTIAHQLVTVFNRVDLASWNKIIWLIEKASCTKSNGFLEPITRHTLVKSWRKYEKVAHLWAAHMFFGGYWHKVPPLQEDVEIHYEMEAHLALAHTLQEFGTKKTTDRAKKSFLNGEIITRIDVPLECDFRTPFPQSWIPILEAYVAPKDMAN